jgi:hypothetical protein
LAPLAVLLESFRPTIYAFLADYFSLPHLSYEFYFTRLGPLSALALFFRFGLFSQIRLLELTFLHSFFHGALLELGLFLSSTYAYRVFHTRLALFALLNYLAVGGNQLFLLPTPT